MTPELHESPFRRNNNAQFPGAKRFAATTSASNTKSKTQTPSAERLTRLEVLTGVHRRKRKESKFREDNKIINRKQKCNECETRETA
ncbi:hypothetical protein CDAR_89161 [Caerostris darwini]|uniref:Uncharacterized protein n=1 Tax=Caerostris darwini TaxID=1538125 RepID=A0AAV4U9N4_9ARAC|nr:hypothetical protein CDAR_89161 [Caerostris darwini]